MMFWRRFGFSDAAAAVLAILLAVFGGGIWAVVQAPPETDVAAPQTPEVQIAAQDSAAEAVTSGETQPTAEIAANVPEPSGPSLDLVRVSPEGDAVVAGSTTPGAEVIFLVNGDELARATADGSGSFVGLFTIPSSDQPNSITVATEAEDGSWVSDESIFVAAIVAPEPVVEPDVAPVETQDTVLDVAESVTPEEPAQVIEEVATAVEAPELIEIPEATIDVAQAEVTQSEVAEPDTTQADAAPIDTADPVEPVRTAPTIVIANSEGVEVLQPAPQPKAPTVEANINVVIDTISYDDDGEVALVGRGSGDGFVRVYLDGAPVLTVPVDDDGSWSTPLAGVDAGVYQLRVDELSQDGTVTSRVETPFQREEIEVAAGALPTAITVQTGSTLWAIAENRFGNGDEYIRVFNANRDLIRDPDLIYPGQVFVIPEE